MPIRLRILAVLFLGGLVPALAQGPHTLDTSLALPGTPVLTLRQGGNVFAEGAAFDNRTDTLYKYASGGQAFNDVSGDSRDNLYFTNFRGRSVFFRSASGSVDTVLRDQNMPNGIEWDEERNRVYVNLNGENKVVAYTVAADHSLIDPADFATVPASDGIVLDERGNVYAVAFGDRVHVFSRRAPAWARSCSATS